MGSYQTRVFQGLCPLCGKNKPEVGRVCCQPCVDKKKQKYYRDRSKNGLCRLCGQNKVEGDYKICSECRQKSREKKQSNIKNGICRMCGVNKAVAGRLSCKKCLKEKSLRRQEEFSKQGLCKQCGQNKAIDGLTICIDCREIRRNTRKRRIEEGICVRCGSRKARKGMRDCIECSEMTKKTRDEIKRMVINEYGGCCSCCGEKEMAFLTIDHVLNNGSKHRKEIGTGHNIYNWLVKMNYPKNDYQVLCFNCNQGRYINGGVCPHKGHK